jgi:hypothetical protein
VIVYSPVLLRHIDICGPWIRRFLIREGYDHLLSVKTHRQAATGNTRSREASGTAGGPRSLGQRPSDLAHTLAW